MGVVAEAEAASVADAVFASVGHEAVEVVVAPRESELQESGTKCGCDTRSHGSSELTIGGSGM